MKLSYPTILKSKLEKLPQWIEGIEKTEGQEYLFKKEEDVCYNIIVLETKNFELRQYRII